MSVKERKKQTNKKSGRLFCESSIYIKNFIIPRAVFKRSFVPTRKISILNCGVGSSKVSAWPPFEKLPKGFAVRIVIRPGANPATFEFTAL
jgi:hypothetical protein